MLGRNAGRRGTGTVQADTLSPGTQLAGRYRIEDLVGETPGSQTWRALDRILNRSVSVQVLPGDDDRSAAFLTAARAATVVEDPRFLRVLDADREAGYAYVVREWARGVSLDTVLAAGSAALGTRRRAGARGRRGGRRRRIGPVCQHGRIDPARIIVKHNGAITGARPGHRPGPVSAGVRAEQGGRRDERVRRAAWCRAAGERRCHGPRAAPLCLPGGPLARRAATSGCRRRRPSTAGCCAPARYAPE